MADKVLVPAQLHPDGKRYLQEHGFEVVELMRANAENILKNGKDATAMILFLDPVGEKVISQMPNLKIIARHGVGYDSVDLDASARHGVWVTNTPNANAATVAETTLAEILDVSKHLTKDSMEMRAGNSAYPLSHLGFDLEGKTLGILGYGKIGRLVAKKASGLGMRILIYNRTPRESLYGEFVDLDTLLKSAGILTLHLAANPQTRHIIGRPQLAEMKRGSMLINLGRGVLVDTDALIEALKTGSIRGAALDVFDEEPLPMSSELFKLDNVLLTPHIGSSTVESFSRMATDAASEVVRILSGDSPQWPVNHPL